MKQFLSLLLAVFVAGIGLAQTPTVFPNIYKQQSAEVLGAGNAYIYYSGRDTIGPSVDIAKSGHDTAITTGWLPINWRASNAGTFPNKTLSDSLTIIGANMFWVWVSPDTTSLTSGDSIGYRKLSNADSSGVAKMEWRVALTAADTATGYPAWLPDSTNIFVLSGYYSHSQYGIWVFEPRIGAISVAGTIKRWRVYPIRVPPAAWLQVRFRASDAMKEFVVVNWRVVAIKG